ncbi:Rha family transcriptional regulator [Bacillus thuringiensis]|nr:Rha family transcriptional regulator [Bacillus thuringiensis]
MKEIGEKGNRNFEESSYNLGNGRNYKKYNMTKDGFTLLVMDENAKIRFLLGVPPAFRKKTTLRKSELKNQKIYHYSKTHTVSFFIQKIIQHNINCVVLGVIININLGV